MEEKGARNMKRVIIAILCFLLFIPIVSAHSGKTDGNGGHYNTSTGEYHYHHGYPEHQHIDGMCPYGFDDKTNRYSNNYYYEDPPRKDQNDQGWQSIITQIILWAFVAYIAYYVIRFIISIIGSLIKAKKEKKQKELDFLRKKQEYTLLYGGLTNDEILSLVNPPEGVYINQDGILSFEESDRFFVYISKTGKVFHKKGCNKQASNPRLIYTFWQKHKYSPCKKCKPDPLIDDTWYYEYKRIIGIKDKYSI